MNLDYWRSIKGFFYEIYPPFFDAIAAFLGDYAMEVMAAYCVSIILLLSIVLMSVRRSRRVLAQLTTVEALRKRSK